MAVSILLFRHSDYSDRLLAPLLGIGLELLLERCELCKGRIGVGHLVARVAAVAAALDVFRAQRRIAIGTVATLGAIAAPEALGAVAAGRRTIGPGRTIGAKRTLRCVSALGPLGTLR